MCIKSVWRPRSWSFRSDLCITCNSSSWCDDALDGASGDSLDLETYFPILGTVWEKISLFRACPVQHHHFPRSLWIQAPWTPRTHTKQARLFWPPPLVQVQGTYPLQSTGLWVKVSFQIQSPKGSTALCMVQTALRQEQSPYPSVQPEGILQWINEVKAWTGAAEPVSLLLQ